MMFIDSNVLVSLFISSAPFHKRAAAFFDTLIDSGESVVISPQVIMESFRAMTHEKIFPDRVNAAQFREVIIDFLTDPAVVLVGPNRKTVDLALYAAEKKDIRSSTIYDYQLYGTMLEHGITKIATFNVKHFRGLEGIELVEIP